MIGFVAAIVLAAWLVLVGAPRASADDNSVNVWLGSGQEVVVEAMSPDGARLWVSLSDGVVDVIDVATLDVVKTFDFTDIVVGIAFTPDGSEVVMSGGGLPTNSSNLWKFHTATFAVVASVLVEPGKGSVVVSNDGSVAYVNTPNGLILVSFSNYFQRLILDINGRITGVAFSPTHDVLYAAATNGNIYAYSSNGDTAQITVPNAGAATLVLSPDGNTLYAAEDDGDLLIIDTVRRAVTETLSVGFYASALALSGDGAALYLLYPGPQLVTLDSKTLEQTAAFSGIAVNPSALAVSPDGSSAYVGNLSGFIQVVGLSRAPVSLAQPVVHGVAKVGQTLTADPGVWSPTDVTTSVEWLDGETNLGTGLTLVVPSSALGHSLTLAVTGSLGGYPSTTRSVTIDMIESEFPVASVFQPYLNDVGSSLVGLATTAPSTLSGTAILTQSFTKGMLVYAGSTGVHFIPNGPIQTDWLEHEAAYGAPLSDQFTITPDSSWANASVGAGKLQYFEHEGLVDSDAHGLARIPGGQVLAKYRSVGAAKIGWPIPGPVEAGAVPGTSDTVYAIHFDLETVVTTPAGPYAMDNALYQEWKAETFGHGDYPSVGYPTGDSFQVTAAQAPAAGSGVIEWFEAGALGAPTDSTGAVTRTPAFVPGGGVLTYLRSEGVNVTGWPVSAPDCLALAGGCFEQFDLGRVTVSSGRSFLVPTALVPAWSGSAATTFIGYPSGEAFSISDVGEDSGLIQWFAAGAVVRTGDHGAWFVPAGAVLTALRMQGVGKLGWPAGAAACPTADGCYQPFTIEAIAVSANGVHPIPVAVFAAWIAEGGPAVLGYPTGDAVVSDGMTTQQFTGGSISV